MSDSASPWTVAYQVPQSTEFSRQEYWSGVPLPHPVYMLSHVQLFATPWTIGHQAPLSMEFSRQEYWSGLPFPPPGYLHDSRIESSSPAFQADSLPLSYHNPSNNKICQTRSGGLSHCSLLPAITKASLLCCMKMVGREIKGKERHSGEKQKKAENKNHIFPSFLGVRN